MLFEVTKENVENLCHIFESWTQENEWGLLVKAVEWKCSVNVVKQANLQLDYGDTKCVHGFIVSLWYKFVSKFKSSSPSLSSSSSSSSSLLYWSTRVRLSRMCQLNWTRINWLWNCFHAVLEKTGISQLARYSQHFVTHEGLLPCSQQPTSCPLCGSDQSVPRPSFLFL